MAMTDKSETTGAEGYRWDLGAMYAGIDDPRIESDLSSFERLAKEFNGKYRGKLSELLGPSLTDQMALTVISSRLTAFMYMAATADLSDEAVKAKGNSVERRLMSASGECLQFYELEICALSDEDVSRQVATDAVCVKHEPLIRQIRRFKDHQLSEEVESALAKRSPFGAGAWGEYHEETEADLNLLFEGRDRTLVEMVDMMSHDPSAERRAAAMSAVDAALAGPFVKFASRALSVETGAKAVEDRDRKYASPLSERNLANQIPDEVVEALHAAVTVHAGPLCRRYYALKAKLLGFPILRWSDRNAPLPYADGKLIPYEEAMTIVSGCYRSFSPTLASLVERVADKRWIDAPAIKNKRSGAFNYTVPLAADESATYVMLNYLGTHNDVKTLAHELGHAVHGLLASEAQGPLMAQAPTAYAETASVFGEQIVFQELKGRMTDDPKKRLAFICGKIDDAMNTVVRQIGFSNFEKKIHGAGRQLSEEEINSMWVQSLQELYGADGEIFTYKDAARLWSYVSHFHRPFYCYGYAFGELLTQSLHAVKDDFGDRFEPLYLDLLRAGGTKNASELLAPFGLDPTDPDFWKRGIDAGLGKLVAEAEGLASKMDQ